MSTARICIVAPEFIGPFPNGGVGTACYWEALALGNAGYDVTVLYTGPTERETPDYWEDHFARTAPFAYVDIARHSFATIGTTLASHEFPCAEARTAEVVLAWLRQRHFDLVLFQEFLGHGARALQARQSGHALAGVRAATTMHSCRQWIYEGMHRLPSRHGDLAVDFLEKTSAQLADCAVAPSEHMARWATSRWHIAPEPTVIPYCYDDTLARPAEIVTHRGPFRHLVFFGRLETRKGLHLFCRALANTPDLRDHVDRVTFLGKCSSVEGRSSQEFIAAQLGRIKGLQWTIESGLGSLEAQAWLASQQNALVVAPSIVDNLPYAVIELHTRRIPFVSSKIGGIPEIVGPANAHALADATEASLAETLLRVCRTGSLTIDYASGYNVAQANRAHLDFVARLLAAPAAEHPPSARRPFDVVVTNVADPADLARARSQAIATDERLIGARWLTFDGWRAKKQPVPTLFIDDRVALGRAAVAHLLETLDRDGVDMATSYFVRQGGDHPRVITPLGPSLEGGWRQNVFGGPCMAVAAPWLSLMESCTVGGAFSFWCGYAAAACAGASLAIVPEALYTTPSDALGSREHAEVETVLTHYHTQAPGSLDLGWVLKTALPTMIAAAESGAETIVGEPGRAMYERLISTPDELLMPYAHLESSPSDAFYREGFARVRQTLAGALTRWGKTEPRVYIYGAGEHTRLMLMLCPELGRHLAGFIDRRPMSTFLGKPCLMPDDFRSDMADVIVYSSREYEHEMYERMKELTVEHVLIYRDGPAPTELSTTSRLCGRFGHIPANLHGLSQVYQPPTWVRGAVALDDAAFLVELIAAVQPKMVAEIGVASGGSSAAILFGLDQLPDVDGGRILISCDVNPRCYFDKDYETGQACREMYPSPRALWQREFTTDARKLRDLLPAQSADLVFIDANHAHPMPLLDLLHVTDIVKPGSWVVLHDIDLPFLHPQYQLFGPRFVFEAWPFNKVKGIGRWASIGAIQIPADPASLVDMALSVVRRPWEYASPTMHLGLPATFAKVEESVMALLAAEDRAA
jgi:glycosyltransferase involved in cell wall biosynthesis/predicted O-methyltransferase YrrM